MIKQFLLVLIFALAGSSSQAQKRKKDREPEAPQTGKYTYTVGNGTDWEINFFLSTDSIKWEQFNLEPSHQAVLRYENEKLWFKIYTTHGKQVLYKVRGNITYKIYFNPDGNKFDLLKFDGSSYLDQ